MRSAQNYYPDCPEEMIIGLARSGDRDAFAELVRRRQRWIRNLMKRCCHDMTLADDLAQQVFLQVWRKIHSLKKIDAFDGWLKRLAISVWLQHHRKNDTLQDADALDDLVSAPAGSVTLGMDLEKALATLPDSARLCIVLSYQLGMSHAEIADYTQFPLGTIKSHIQRGTQRLQQILSAYRDETSQEDV